MILLTDYDLSLIGQNCPKLVIQTVKHSFMAYICNQFGQTFSPLTIHYKTSNMIIFTYGKRSYSFCTLVHSLSDIMQDIYLYTQAYIKWNITLEDNLLLLILISPTCTSTKINLQCGIILQIIYLYLFYSQFHFR